MDSPGAWDRWVEPTFVYSALILVMLVGLAIPLCGWVTLVPFAAYAMNGYANQRRAEQRKRSERLSNMINYPEGIPVSNLPRYPGSD